MQLTIVPVRERPAGGLLRDRLPGRYAEDPAALYALLRKGGPEARAALQGAQFVLLSTGPSTSSAVEALAQQMLGNGRDGWRCKASNSYAVCAPR